MNDIDKIVCKLCDRISGSMYNVPSCVRKHTTAELVRLNCIGFCDTYRTLDIGISEFVDSWYELFQDVCFMLGFNRSGASALWSGARSIDCHGMTVYEFIAYVAYCSDKWSLEKLLRAQGIFRRWLYEANREACDNR